MYKQTSKNKSKKLSKSKSKKSSKNKSKKYYDKTKLINIWSLDKLDGFNKNVQDNIKIIHNKYGSNFRIKYKNINIPVILDKFTLEPQKETYYRLYYNSDDNTQTLLPFKIYFMNPLNAKKDNVTYIANIHKTDQISGSDMIKLVLEINRSLGVERIYLIDGASIQCNDLSYDLSFLKLLEKGLTFYMKFGFRMYHIKTTSFFGLYQSEEELMDKINELIDKIKKIKVKDLIKEYNLTLNILTTMIKTNDYDYEIISNDFGGEVMKPNLSIQYDNPSNRVTQLVNECKSMLDILNKYDDYEYFYELCIDIFNDRNNCYMYDTISKYIFYSDRSKIIYKNKQINRDYQKVFEYLLFLRSNFMFYYDF